MNENIPHLPDFDEPTLDSRFRHPRRRGSHGRHDGCRSLPPTLARPQARPPQTHQRSLAKIRATRSQKGPRHPFQPTQAADRSRPRSPNIGSSKVSGAGNRHLPPRRNPSPRHPPPPPQNHARDHLRLPPSRLLHQPRPPGRVRLLTSKPSTFPPTTQPATPRTPSSSLISPQSPAATASSCAPTPARFKSAP